MKKFFFIIGLSFSFIPVFASESRADQNTAGVEQAGSEGANRHGRFAMHHHCSRFQKGCGWNNRFENMSPTEIANAEFFGSIRNNDDPSFQAQRTASIEKRKNAFNDAERGEYEQRKEELERMSAEEKERARSDWRNDRFQKRMNHFGDISPTKIANMEGLIGRRHLDDHQQHRMGFVEGRKSSFNDAERSEYERRKKEIEQMSDGEKERARSDWRNDRLQKKKNDPEWVSKHNERNSAILSDCIKVLSPDDYQKLEELMKSPFWDLTDEQRSEKHALMRKCFTSESRTESVEK
ncbi:MAG: hypothetical protein HEEMFOPI_00291 [Holosporales bacterium]